MRDLLRLAFVSSFVALVGCGGGRPTIRDASKNDDGTPPPHAVDPPYFPGFGVTDVDHRVAAFSGSGALTLVSLSDGSIAWTNQEGWFLAPLVVHGNRVFAAEKAGEHALDVATIDRESGKTVAHSHPIALPEWAPVAPMGGGATNVSARVGDDGALVMHWTSSTSYWGGVAPTPDMLAASTHHAEGAARVDLTTGAVSVLSDDEAKHEGEVQTHTPPALGALPANLPEEAKYSGPVIVGDRLYYTTTTGMTSASASVDTALHAFDVEHGVALWDRVVRRDPVFMPPP